MKTGIAALIFFKSEEVFISIQTLPSRKKSILKLGRFSLKDILK